MQQECQRLKDSIIASSSTWQSEKDALQKELAQTQTRGENERKNVKRFSLPFIPLRVSLASAKKCLILLIRE